MREREREEETAMDQELDYETLTWEDIHLSERARSLLNESAGIFRYLAD